MFILFQQIWRFGMKISGGAALKGRGFIPNPLKGQFGMKNSGVCSPKGSGFHSRFAKKQFWNDFFQAEAKNAGKISFQIS